MAWQLYKENVLEHLIGRLDEGRYCNGHHPYLQSRFVKPLLNHFPHGGEYLAEYEQDGNILCALVVTEYSKISAGAYVDGVSQISLNYVDHQLSIDKLAQIIQSLFRVLPKYYLAINFELQDPDLVDIEKFQAMKNTIVKACALNTSIPAAIGFEEYWSERPKSVRKDIARRLRALERENTHVRYSVRDHQQAMQEGFSRYCDLEGSGWKGENGTALTETNNQGQFYKQVMTEFARTGESKIHELYFNDKIVASLLAIENDEMIIVMKTAYDENVSKYSPGRLLDYYMLQSLLTEKNAKKMENYTNASANDQKWFPRVREMYDVTVYRSSWAEQLARLKHKLRG